MEQNVDVDEVRRKANQLLQDLLDRHAERPNQEIAHSITNLAFEDGNPVRNLFLTAVPNGKQRSYRALSVACMYPDALESQHR